MLETLEESALEGGADIDGADEKEVGDVEFSKKIQRGKVQLWACVFHLRFFLTLVQNFCKTRNGRDSRRTVHFFYGAPQASIPVTAFNDGSTINPRTSFQSETREIARYIHQPSNAVCLGNGTYTI
jgi:hypothetical protein